jgi:hypothetical protein
MVAEHLGEGSDEAEVLVGIETERGPWVAALLAAGYTVYAVNPLQAARYRERHGVSGRAASKSDDWLAGVGEGVSAGVGARLLVDLGGCRGPVSLM